MAKRKTIYTCQQCGAQSPKWLGKCPECGAWNSYAEETFEPPETVEDGKGWRPAVRRDASPQRFGEVGGRSLERLPCGIVGLDVVLGGGLVPGSLILLSGEPGAGKSTLMLQAAAHVARHGTVLYVSGEESEGQVKMRGERLGVDPGDLFVFSETDLERILSELSKLKPSLLIVDSVQTTYSARFASAPGSVTQVRETAAQLLSVAKSTGVPVLLVGHVNKEGQIAGPKAMEHIVDTVILLEGERFQHFRVLRALKNRFGPVSEIAVFEMLREGLIEVANPSELFLAERAAGTPGSAVTATVEGTRPLLVEVQALLSPIAYGAGRRTSEGFDHNRLALLLAILERRGGLNVAANDVFVNVVGGVRLAEPAVDLAVAAALASSLLDKPLPDGATFFGELGLGGEIRSVTAADLRVKEAATIGMSSVYLPRGNARKLGKDNGIELKTARNIEQFLRMLFSA